LVDNHLLPAATNSKARVYALKLRADCCRYWAEETAGENKRELAERSQYAYQQAWVGTWMRVAIGGLRVVASLTAGSNGCMSWKGSARSTLCLSLQAAKHASAASGWLWTDRVWLLHPCVSICAALLMVMLFK
jgi:hypothetical protein